ncbi:MAG: hypothetical protein B6U88_00930 [Candidatus Aenigmarchaeota archaeon ex4484_56]|nr:MAG: hypothetical protein B6U88_00930 [Candidatus Aenigmarchaeota archaeon ex4484_56]
MKKIIVNVIPNAKENKILKENEHYKVYISVPPIEGKANKKLIEMISKYFNIKKNNIKIIKGKKSRNKIIILEG